MSGCQEVEELVIFGSVFGELGFVDLQFLGVIFSVGAEVCRSRFSECEGIAVEVWIRSLCIGWCLLFIHSGSGNGCVGIRMKTRVVVVRAGTRGYKSDSSGLENVLSSFTKVGFEVSTQFCHVDRIVSCPS